ncbi:MAG: ammonium transporter [Planctomycetes bacterium]|nr:ammonium transporter [Planctomycetota bacterium]
MTQRQAGAPSCDSAQVATSCESNGWRLDIARGLRFIFTVAVLSLPGALAWAEDPKPSAPAPVATLDKADQAWMLMSCALVFLMTAPGLALFYSGLVRKKNVLGVMMQCLMLAGLMTVLWGLYGYSLSFGGAPGEAGFSPWVGNGDFVLMRNVTSTFNEATGLVETPVEGSISRLTHMLFQGMFFIITPALICGAFAERMKFSTMVAFMILWGTLVYCPLCHWVWDGGILAFGAADAKFGALDFAGGTVVHISSGVSALVCALVMGKRLGFGHEPMPPHNLTYTVVGAALLWFGWFGFNAGSALNSGAQAASAFCATHFAAAAGALAWPLLEWVFRGKPTVLGCASGAVAGLVCITPASGYVAPMPALAMGLAAGAVCFYACTALKSKFGYDDSLDAFGVHGVGGTLGAVLTGVFATRNITPEGTSGGKLLGLLEGGPLLTPQVMAALVTWVYAAVATFVLLKILDVAMGLRVTQQDEVQGLDYSQHGEEGYIFI